MPEFIVIIGRSILSFLILFVLARILGKKQISQLTFFDYVVGIAIGDMASTISIDPSMHFLDGVIGLVVYTALSLLFIYGALKSFKIRELVESSPSILVKNGKIMEESLAKHKLTYDDLLNGLRVQGAFSLSEVELAILETDGQISVMKKPQFQSLTPNDIGLKVSEDHAPSLIIVDGLFMERRLHYLGYSTKWFLDQIKKQGAKEIKDIFLAQVNSDGTVYVDLYKDDQKTQQENHKPQISAQLRRVQADLESVANQTNDRNAKQMYYNQSMELQNVINRINPYLKEIGAGT
ncbi:DUF421 domain-containing protein [Niallia endozanthoxylica]|uniref:DUF421 domain-containing protein n=1 Tax=Niallia endozanthoxylica TaxID=2036016 RepID=A0A5J5H5C1_9BACI|nr:DUF421 domain-containing protein [Niallia endozanthoxylica]KAA9015741.1 DUF421 domain-containing protein [Niallia endozanthoxylica]